MPSKTWRLWGTGEVSFSKEKTVRKALRVRRAGRSGQDKNTGQQKSYMRKGATEQGEQRSQRAPTGEAQRSQVGERKRRREGQVPALAWEGQEDTLPTFAGSREKKI